MPKMLFEACVVVRKAQSHAGFEHYLFIVEHFIRPTERDSRRAKAKSAAEPIPSRLGMLAIHMHARAYMRT